MPYLDRRHALALLGALPAAGLVTRAAAQTPAAPALPGADAPPSVITPPVPATLPAPAPAVPATTLIPASPPLPTTPLPTTPPASTPPATTPPRPSAAIDRTKAYWVLFDRIIDIPAMRDLRRQMTTLVEAGVLDITLVLHSPGGLIDPMMTTYSFLRALPVRIDTHAVGFVQSAATVLFLVGQNRSADRGARFLFHPSQVPFNGSMSSPQMQDRQTQFASVNTMTAEILRDRTTLDDAEIARFNREEVIYTATQARDAGIVQTVADLKIPGPNQARILFLD